MLTVIKGRQTALPKKKKAICLTGWKKLDRKHGQILERLNPHDSQFTFFFLPGFRVALGFWMDIGYRCQILLGHILIRHFFV